MKPIKINLPTEFTSIEIIPMADLHLGDPNCKYKDLQDTIKYVLEKENRYVILNGDLMDSAIKSSIGDTYSATLQPMEQLKHCVSLFGELAEKGRILAVLPGNHEGRIYKQDGIDMTEMMCSQLGISDRYSNTTAILFIRFGYGYKGLNDTKGRKDKLCYTMYCTHGSGGGRKEGGKINRLADLACIIDADIYVMSHTHLPVVMKEAYYRISASNSTVQLVDKLFVNTNAYLGYGGYGDAQNYKPASTEQPRIILDGTKKKFKALL